MSFLQTSDSFSVSIDEDFAAQDSESKFLDLLKVLHEVQARNQIRTHSAL